LKWLMRVRVWYGLGRDSMCPTCLLAIGRVPGGRTRFLEEGRSRTRHSVCSETERPRGYAPGNASAKHEERRRGSERIAPAVVLWRLPLAEAGFILALVLGIWLLVSIIHSGRF